MKVESLGQEDSLEEGMTTHSRILAWRIPWTEEPGGLQSIGLQRVMTEEAEHTAHVISFDLYNSSTKHKEVKQLSKIT